MTTVAYTFVKVKEHRCVVIMCFPSRASVKIQGMASFNFHPKMNFAVAGSRKCIPLITMLRSSNFNSCGPGRLPVCPVFPVVRVVYPVGSVAFLILEIGVVICTRLGPYNNSFFVWGIKPDGCLFRV